MIQNLPVNNLNRVSNFSNAVFYCSNESEERVPVGIVKNISIVSDNVLEFQLSHFPVMVCSWNVFAAELNFYQKGLPYNMKVHGTAWFTNKDDLTVQLKALHIENFGQPEVKNYSLQDTLAEFFSSTGLFFKRMLVTGF